MYPPRTLDELECLLREARTALEVFAGNPDGNLERLLALCDPDCHPGDVRAHSLYRQVHELADRARQPLATIPSPRRTYTLLQRLAAGDIADVHLAHAVGRDYVVKVSRQPGGDALLDNERRALAAILTRAGDTTYRKYFPLLAESFLIGDGSQRVNVFAHEPGFCSLEEVHARHPALDGRHLAWIFKRLLTAIGFAHRCGYMHGAVLPAHVRVHPGNHGLQLLDWSGSVESGKILTLPTKYRTWYPPEVIQKQGVGPATDIYLAAKTMIYLGGGEPAVAPFGMPDSVPLAMQRFFRSCVLEGSQMRPQDAWELLAEFDEMLVGLYGPPQFHPLSMS